MKEYTDKEKSEIAEDNLWRFDSLPAKEKRWPITQAFSLDITANGGTENTIALQKKEIIKAIIFSKQGEWPAMSGIKLYTMSGFLERTGRLPTKDDVIQMYYYLFFLDIFPGTTILRSEVNFEIL